ncbi:MAG: hypothetical protein KIT68_12185 [Phycisphaeraceae bacterium]|nr:hypothetical protein [Phycisphaeraceae bacterium]
MPVGDWQFWVVSLVVLAAAGWLARGVLPVPWLSRRRRRARRERRATLTIGGKAPR